MNKTFSFLNATPNLGDRVYIHPSAQVIGQVTLGDDVSIWPTAVVRGDVNSIEIGEASNIQDGSILHVTHVGPYSPEGFPLKIGQGVTIGHKVILHGCTIHNYCLIGMGTLIMDGVVVEDFVLIGAGSVVPPGKRLQAKSLYLGNPAKKIRDLNEQEIEQLQYSSAHYIRLKDVYLDEIKS
jgi:carbonic anhydrase/acetyltransferase-like protein (isoleucine patch superfamily)